MNWIRLNEWAGQSGIWTIAEKKVCEVSRFQLYRMDTLIGTYDSKDTAKMKAEELNREAA